MADTISAVSISTASTTVAAETSTTSTLASSVTTEQPIQDPVDTNEQACSDTQRLSGVCNGNPENPAQSQVTILAPSDNLLARCFFLEH